MNWQGCRSEGRGRNCGLTRPCCQGEGLLRKDTRNHNKNGQFTATWKPTSARAMPAQGVGSDLRSTLASRLGFLQDVDVGNRTPAAIANGRLRWE